MNEKTNLITKYNSIDLVKFIMSILVVSIHVPPFGENASKIFKILNFGVRNWLAKLAVPFFFIATGFLLYNKYHSKDCMKNIQRYLYKLTILYLKWTAIYFPLIINSIINNENGIIYGFLRFVRNFFLVGSITHLWYLPATIYSVIIVFFFVSKTQKVKPIMILGGVLYIFGVLTDSWFSIINPIIEKSSFWNIAYNIFKIIFVTPRNGIFEGVLFVSIGVYIARNKCSLSSRYILFSFLLSLFLMLIESILVLRTGLAVDYNLYFSLPFVSYFLFELVIRINLSYKYNYIQLRNLSSLVFLGHIFINSGFNFLFKRVGIAINNTPLAFIMTVAVSVFISFLILKLSKKYKNNTRHLTPIKNIKEI